MGKKHKKHKAEWRSTSAPSVTATGTGAAAYDGRLNGQSWKRKEVGKGVKSKSGKTFRFAHNLLPFVTELRPIFPRLR